MEQFDIFLENVLLCRACVTTKLTKEQQQYVKRTSQTENRTVKEYVKYVAAITSTEDRDSFKKILKTLPNIYGDYETLIELLKPLFILFKPKLSELLGCSHVFCDNNCSLYRSGRIAKWASRNPELFDTDVYFYVQIVSRFLPYINIDVPLYTFEEISGVKPTDETIEHDCSEKLKQLYSIIYYYNSL